MRSSLASVLVLISGLSVAHAMPASSQQQRAGAKRSVKSAPAIAKAFTKGTVLGHFKEHRFDAVNHVLDAVEANELEFSSHNPDAGKFADHETGGWKYIGSALKQMKAFHASQNAALKAARIDEMKYPEKAAVLSADERARKQKSQALFSPLGLTASEAYNLESNRQEAVYVASSMRVVQPEYVYDHRVPIAQSILAKQRDGRNPTRSTDPRKTYFVPYANKLAELRESPEAMLAFMNAGFQKWGAIEALPANASHEEKMHLTLFHDLTKLMVQSDRIAVRVGTKVSSPMFGSQDLKAEVERSHMSLEIAKGEK